MIVSCTVRAQKISETEVPAEVRSKFTALYPDIKQAEWEKEGNRYEAGIKVKNSEVSVIFDAEGNLIQTESEISVSDLPQNAKDYCLKKLNSGNISEASKIESADGMVTFEAEVNGQDYIFNEKGDFLKKVIEESSEHDAD